MYPKVTTILFSNKTVYSISTVQHKLRRMITCLYKKETRKGGWNRAKKSKKSYGKDISQDGY
jgi:hypothetical protein